VPANRQIHLDNRPQAEATVSNFKLVASSTPALQDGQVLVRHHFLSLDPYMRGRMSDAKNYARPQALGETMIGGTAGEVLESRHSKFAVGDQVVGMGGWQEYSVVNASTPGELRKVDTSHVPLSAYLGALQGRYHSCESACGPLGQLQGGLPPPPAVPAARMRYRAAQR
jgi:NADPH-dependent curcumin reductase CurA